MNALNEPQVVRALYAASQAGVQIDLIIRGACTLRPGVPGVSDNIRVRSIVGRFLEHSRVYWFGNDGAPEMYCASADWLERNLLRRVETCFPILDPELAKRVYREVLQNYLDDNLNAWELDADGIYHKRAGPRRSPHSAQMALMQGPGVSTGRHLPVAPGPAGRDQIACQGGVGPVMRRPAMGFLRKGPSHG
jgi:polyphosphate kinase